MERKQDKPAVSAGKPGHETVGSGRVSVNSFTPVNQDSSKAHRVESVRKNQTTLLPSGSLFETEQEEFVHPEPQQSTNFNMESGSRPTMSPSASSTQTILAKEPAVEQNMEPLSLDISDPEPEYLRFHAELQANFSEQWSLEAVTKAMDNSSDKQTIAELPKINDINFKTTTSRKPADSKLPAYLIQTRGSINPEKCWRCVEGFGPFNGKECISISNIDDPFLKGTCGGCAWSGNNTSCSWNTSHDINKQPPKYRNKVIEAKKKIDAAREENGMVAADESVPQYLETGNIILHYPAGMRLEHAIEYLVEAAQKQRLVKESDRNAARTEIDMSEWPKKESE